MHVKMYWRKVREVEAGIPEEFPIVKSSETVDGGKAGRLSEVSREQAAKLIAEGKATLASDQERARYLSEQAAALKAIEKARISQRLQIAIVNQDDATPTVNSKRRREQTEEE